MRTIPIPVLRVLWALHPEQLPHYPNWKEAVAQRFAQQVIVAEAPGCGPPV